MSVADVAKEQISYDAKKGAIQKIKLIPKIMSVDTGELCPNNGFEIENIGEC
jgi:hypothetical protein